MPEYTVIKKVSEVTLKGIAVYQFV